MQLSLPTSRRSAPAPIPVGQLDLLASHPSPVVPALGPWWLPPQLREPVAPYLTVEALPLGVLWATCCPRAMVVGGYTEAPVGGRTPLSGLLLRNRKRNQFLLSVEADGALVADDELPGDDFDGALRVLRERLDAAAVRLGRAA